LPPPIRIASPSIPLLSQEEADRSRSDAEAPQPTPSDRGQESAPFDEKPNPRRSDRALPGTVAGLGLGWIGLGSPAVKVRRWEFRDLLPVLVRVIDRLI